MLPLGVLMLLGPPVALIGSIVGLCKDKSKGYAKAALAASGLVWLCIICLVLFK